MADKTPEELSREDQIAQAKEFYALGYRNYVVGDFDLAAEDLSRSCELYAKLYGDESEEVAIPNLFYGKTLIELAQMGENKVLALPDEQDDGKGEDEGDSDEDSEIESRENAPQLAKIAEENGTDEGSCGAGGSSSTDPQPGPSTSTGQLNGNGAGPSNDDTVDEGDEEANENLQYAWEALEMAATIFRRLGDSHEEYLAEAHCGLGEILMENQNCADALKDYNIAYDIYSKLEKPKVRLLAEIKYKSGLCHYSGMSYDQSIADFQKSADYMKEAIEAQKKLEQTPQVEQTIDDLTKMREDILDKIADVQESKQLLMSNLHGNLATQSDMLGSIIGGTSSSGGASSSGSSSKVENDKPKPMDISHLIKRKKPDTPNETDSNIDTATPSPAKKPSLN